VFVTVWSPTVIALALSVVFSGMSGLRELGGLLGRFAKNPSWYLVAAFVPMASLAVAIFAARQLRSGAPFIVAAALPFTIGLQLITGATGEELGWRGFLLLHLENRFHPRVAAVLMGIFWSLWHLPSFYLPGMPQQQMPPVGFLLMVAGFGLFLALLLNRTRGSLASTMLAHFSFNLCLAVGGATLRSTFIWTLAAIFLLVGTLSFLNFSDTSLARGS
jgi:uncharacterized protein